jgi:hypothetical protein
MITRGHALLVVLLGAAGTGALGALMQETISPADLVLTNGRMVTVEESQPEAQAIAITGPRIVALGSSAGIARHVGPTTRVIDVQGRLVIPGFVESHGHFTGLGENQLTLNLTNARSWDEIVTMVAEAVKSAKRGEWIHGRGWHQEKWTSIPSPNVEGFPTHASLDRVSPENPVVLTHASGHAVFANARALALSGVTRDSRPPAGGDILKGKDGEPTGLLRETAENLIKEPESTPEERAARARTVLELADREALSKGITSFHDAGASFATIDLMKRMVDEGALGVRLWVMVNEGNEAEAPKLAGYRMVDYGGGHLTVRAIKRQIDGALGSRGAWLLEPYSDKADSTGLNTTPLESIRETARLALANRYQLCVHAIGDRANRETLDIFERAFSSSAAKNLRWRIEHAQHLHPLDIPRFGQLGVIASMQAVHATSDAPYVLARLGDRRAAEGAYMWQTLLRSGAVVSNGTDAPVEDVDPVAGYYATVSRKTKDGKAFYPEQRMSRMEALRSYTLNGAYAAFEENSRGSLAVGKYADLVVLSRDILTVPEDEIPGTEVVYTVVGGRITYQRP